MTELRSAVLAGSCDQSLAAVLTVYGNWIL